jgi:hypothetical protein
MPTRPIAWGDFQGQMPPGMAAPGWGVNDPRYADWYARYDGPDKAALPPPQPAASGSAAALIRRLGGK